jgi:putative SOS response-associated peptidase YedK
MCGRFALGRDRDAVLEEAVYAFQQGMNGPRHHRRRRNNNQEEPLDEDVEVDEEEENWDNDAPIEWVDRDDFYPRYNVAPRTRVPVLRVEVRESQPVGKKRRVLQTMV